MTIAFDQDPEKIVLPANGASKRADRIAHVVDDMSDQLRFMERHLGRCGFAVELHSGLDGLRRAMAERDADAIFIDVRLGPIDAVDVLHYLAGRHSKAKIFLISGDGAAMDIARRYAEEVGIEIADCLVKPFSGVQLAECVSAGASASGPGGGIETLDVREAMARGWLYPVFQPKLDLRSERIESAELLCRIAHPQFGTMAIHNFISELSQEQRHALFLANIDFVRRHLREFPQPLRINVNVDLANFITQREVLDDLRRESPQLFDALMFEITEEVLCEIDAENLKALYKLCINGAKLSIDDFGTGQSGFARLSRLPFREVKIDSSIVNGCSQAPARKVMIGSIITMSHNLGARVVAEGVEQPEDLAFLGQAGCDEVQGYLVARPMRLERLVPFIEEFNRAFANQVADALPGAIIKADDAEVSRPGT